ncbi:MAG: glycosyl hydrolase-related protein [Bryobacteraceae bacterium]|jgi:alpha-mannosidase
MTRGIRLVLWALLLGATAGAQEPEVFLTPFSHLDFYWGGTREECLARGNYIIAKVIKLAKESPQFRFLLEDEDFVANFVETHQGRPELEDLKRLVKQGQIEIAPKWAAIFSGLPDGEIHVRNYTLGKRYAQRVFGVDPQVAHLADIPDFTPQFPQILSQVRVPFLVMTRMGPSDHSLFQWKAPDGSTTLVWNTLKGYGWGTFLTSKTTSDAEKQARFRKDLADVRPTAPGPILMHWGTDLWAPPDDFLQRIQAFQQTSPAPLRVATPLEFFRRVEKTPGLAELSGEIPTSWPNIVSSLPHLWPQIVPATNTLLAAEKFAAIDYALGYGEYPERDFEMLWRKLVEAMDHNHDGQGGAQADGRKAEYEQLAMLRGGEILRDSLRNIAERVRIPAGGGVSVVVFNPLSWPRDDVVRAHVTLFGDPAPGDIAAYRKGMRLLDETGQAIPFQVEESSENISRALQLVFTAKGVPSLGYRTYYLASADQPQAWPETAQIQLDSDNDRRDPRRALGADTVENAFYRVTIDRATGRVTLFDKALNRDVARDMEISAVEERGGNYIGIEPPSGRTVVAVVDEVRVEENNAVRAVVRITAHVADIPVSQKLTLYRDLDRLDVENTVEWKSPRLLRIEQLFPVAAKYPAFDYGVPFGANRADNLIPHTGTHQPDEISMDDWKSSRHIHDWIRAGAAGWGVTIAADHQQIRLAGNVVRAEMVRGTRFTSVKVVHGEEAASPHYPPAGTYVFRYSVSSGAGDWKAAKAYREGMAFNNPLLPVSVVDSLSAKSLPPSQSFCSLDRDNVVISALKKADGDASVLLRVYEIEGRPEEVTVNFLGTVPAFTRTNLLEEDLQQPARKTLQLRPYEIGTARLARGTAQER